MEEAQTKYSAALCGEAKVDGSHYFEGNIGERRDNLTADEFAALPKVEGHVWVCCGSVNPRIEKRHPIIKATPFADRFIAFQAALDAYRLAAIHAATCKPLTEAERETERLARVELLKLYDIMLTKVQVAGLPA